jgi:hypothetical protein
MRNFGGWWRLQEKAQNNEAPLSKLLGKGSQPTSFSLIPKCPMRVDISEWHHLREDEDAN